MVVIVDGVKCLGKQTHNLCTYGLEHFGGLLWPLKCAYHTRNFVRIFARPHYINTHLLFTGKNKMWPNCKCVDDVHFLLVRPIEFSIYACAVCISSLHILNVHMFTFKQSVYYVRLPQTGDNINTVRHIVYSNTYIRTRCLVVCEERNGDFARDIERWKSDCTWYLPGTRMAY